MLFAGRIGGSFTLEKAEIYVNVLRLKVVLFWIVSLREKLRKTHVKVLFDNTAAVCTINNMGICKS